MQLSSGWAIHKWLYFFDLFEYNCPNFNIDLHNIAIAANYNILKNGCLKANQMVFDPFYNECCVVETACIAIKNLDHLFRFSVDICKSE